MELESFITWALILVVITQLGYLIRTGSRKVKSAPSGGMLVDTSVLMDGRILTLAKTNFIDSTLLIPRSVVGELQLLADTADADKRARARYGLDLINDLQQLKEVNIEILQDGSRASEGVDERLLSLAKQYGYSLCTIDYNLNKVATVEGLKVLNINELSQGLRMAHLPGETMTLDIVQKGQDARQGVGYLADGTMVVVENGSKEIGSRAEVEVIRSLQTAAGRMMFARIRTLSSSARHTQKDKLPDVKSNQTTVTQRQSISATKSQLVSVEKSQKNSQKNNVYQKHANNKQAVRKVSRKTKEDDLMDLVENQFKG